MAAGAPSRKRGGMSGTTIQLICNFGSLNMVDGLNKNKIVPLEIAHLFLHPRSLLSLFVRRREKTT